MMSDENTCDKPLNHLKKTEQKKQSPFVGSHNDREIQRILRKGHTSIIIQQSSHGL